MSEKFNGFSQDEIKKYSVQSNQNKKASVRSDTATSLAFRGAHGEGIRRMTDKMTSKSNLKKQQLDKISQQMPSKRTDTGVTITTTTTNNNNNATLLEETKLNQSMSKSIEEGLFFQPTKKTLNDKISNDQIVEIKGTALSNVNDVMDPNDSSIFHLSNKNNTSASADSTTSCIAFDDSAFMPPRSKRDKGDEENDNVLNLDSPFKGVSLKDFETHRKMIEEQNKQKKEMLHKAIEEYSLKTAAEARKIEEIKSELAKLDNDLALDVAILRKQIDLACMHFANMEKQYMKIESQFLKAKVDLHNAAEKKELLTEHLCTVIAHNEDRKAQKLSELMQKVGLTSAGDLEPKEALPKPTSSNKQ